MQTQVWNTRIVTLLEEKRKKSVLTDAYTPVKHMHFDAIPNKTQRAS